MNGGCFFHDCTGWNGEIYVMNADGSEQARLTDEPGDDGWPTWSPDGGIAFAGLRNVEGGVDEPKENYEIYVVEADGGNLIELTRNTSWDWQPTGIGAAAARIARAGTGCARGHAEARKNAEATIFGGTESGFCRDFVLAEFAITRATPGGHSRNF
jgi:dipeptidyl aminopeptidase/acylaminoacyl peptidase